jgi:hypothetical protein
MPNRTSRISEDLSTKINEIISVVPNNQLTESSQGQSWRGGAIPVAFVVCRCSWSVFPALTNFSLFAVLSRYRRFRLTLSPPFSSSFSRSSPCPLFLALFSLLLSPALHLVLFFSPSFPSPSLLFLSRLAFCSFCF